MRREWHVPIWRYWYFGNWTNLDPFPWLGAYHSSEIPLVFGTSYLEGPDSPLEKATSVYMQGCVGGVCEGSGPWVDGGVWVASV